MPKATGWINTHTHTHFGNISTLLSSGARGENKGRLTRDTHTHAHKHKDTVL